MSDERNNIPQRMFARLHGRKWFSLAGCSIALALGIGGAFWLGGGLAAFMHRQVAEALSIRDYEMAEDILGQMQRLRCANAESFFWEARLRRKQLRISEVPPLLKRAERNGFDPERIRREALLLEAQTGRIRRVVDRMNALLVDPRDDGAEICEAYVNGALIAGAFDLALKILPVWKQEFPDDPHPHYAHARLLEFRGRLEDAREELRTAISKDSRHWPAQYALGRLLFDDQRVEEALVRFEAAAKMRENAAPSYQIARCLQTLGRLDEARSILHELALRPPSSIRDSFMRVGEPQYGRPVMLELGTLESLLGNHHEALRWIDIALNEDPKNVDARYARAMALRGLNRTDEAEVEFAEVQRVRELLKEVDRLVDEINQSPDQPHLEKRCRVGELFIKHENGRRGEFWLRDALNRDPACGPAHALLANYYSELSKKVPAYAILADEHFREAAKYDFPADEPAEWTTSPRKAQGLP